MRSSATSTERIPVSGSPQEIPEVSSQHDAIARLSPVPFEIVELADSHLVAGRRARVHGRPAGRTVEFGVEVLKADERRLALVADGPVLLDVEYPVSPRNGGSELRASYDQCHTRWLTDVTLGAQARP